MRPPPSCWSCLQKNQLHSSSSCLSSCRPVSSHLVVSSRTRTIRMMPKRASSYEPDHPHVWRPTSRMPGAFDDELWFPKRSSMPVLEPCLVHEDEEAVYTLPPSPLERLETINVTLQDIEEHALALTHARPSRASMRSVSVSSTSSADSMSTLLSDLNESIASWQTCSEASSVSTRSLRKKKSPRRESLRDIRTKQSVAQLQQAYESSTLSYLDDSIFSAFMPPALTPRNPNRLSRASI